MQRENDISKSLNGRGFHFDNLYWDSPRQFGSLLLYQIGDIGCDGGYALGEHTQGCYEICYIASGKGACYRQGTAYPTEEGSVFLCLPGERHDGRADAVDPFRILYVGFGFDARADGDGMLAHIKRKFDQVQKPVAADRLGMKAPFLNIFSELINLKDYSGFMMQTYLYQLIVMCYRNFFEGAGEKYAPESGCDEKGRIVYEVMNRIDVNLCGIADLASIAGELGYSYSHLSHVFSRETGLTIMEYYNRERFKKAVEWLQDSQYSITGIAEMLRYRSIHSFSKAFRKNFGISPSEYQALLRNRASG